MEREARMELSLQTANNLQNLLFQDRQGSGPEQWRPLQRAGPRIAQVFSQTDRMFRRGLALRRSIFAQADDAEDPLYPDMQQQAVEHLDWINNINQLRASNQRLQRDRMMERSGVSYQHHGHRDYTRTSRGYRVAQ